MRERVSEDSVKKIIIEFGGKPRSEGHFPLLLFPFPLATPLLPLH